MLEKAIKWARGKGLIPQKWETLKEGGEQELGYLLEQITRLGGNLQLRGINYYHYQGGIMTLDGVHTLSSEQAARELSILLRQSPGMSEFTNSLCGEWKKYSGLYFNHQKKGDKERLEVSFEKRRRGIGFFGVKKGDDNRIHIKVTSKNGLEDVIALDALPETLRPIVSEGCHDYLRETLAQGILPHQSRVHSFGDTYTQAALLAMTGITDEERKKAVKLTQYLHLLDDQIDPYPERVKTLSDISALTIDEATRRIHQLAPIVDLIRQVSPHTEDIDRTILGTIYGAFVQHANNPRDQRIRMEQFKQFVVDKTKNELLKRETEKLHPLLVWTTTHTAMDAFYGIEDENDPQRTDRSDISSLWSLGFAPMLYAHDKEKEASRRGENFRIRYGKELCDNTGRYIADEQLYKVLDAFDACLPQIPDPRIALRARQIDVAYKAFEGTLSQQLRTRYQTTLAKLHDEVKAQAVKN